MKDRLFIEVAEIYGTKKFINVDHIVRIGNYPDSGGTEIRLITGKIVETNEKYEDFKKRLMDLIQYGMPNDRNLDDTTL